MLVNLAHALDRLSPDPWRSGRGFSEDLAGATIALYRANSDDERGRVLGAWLERHQPCLFGRAAAKLALITYCFLTEADLAGPADALRDKIQAKRTEWTRDGYEGRKSAFVILAISERLATAVPSPVVKDIAKTLCSLYLLDDAAEDSILLEDVFLEKPGNKRATWRWKAGVNYFSAQGDGRWWADHRIPGGMALSVNSVGHMVKAGQLVARLNELNAELGVDDEPWHASGIDSLGTALTLAMKTIAGAQETASGRATELLPAPPQQTCPVKLPPPLRDKSVTSYRGYYHTDFTIPSEYFVPDVARRADAPAYELDFTYLFDASPANLAHQTMGKGQRTRDGEFGEVACPFSSTGALSAPTTARKARWTPDEGPPSMFPRLASALAGS